MTLLLVKLADINRNHKSQHKAKVDKTKPKKLPSRVRNCDANVQSPNKLLSPPLVINQLHEKYDNDGPIPTGHASCRSIEFPEDTIKAKDNSDESLKQTEQKVVFRCFLNPKNKKILQLDEERFPIQEA